ncbi:hypothetical protein AOLI_G00100220 [Acnodon oligacanthus]
MKEMETKDGSLREKVVELSVQWGVSSSFTVFLAVHKSSGQPVKGPLDMEWPVGEIGQKGSAVICLYSKSLNQSQHVDSAVWASLLALIWLHSFRTAEEEEWKFIAMKAAFWIRSQKDVLITDDIRLNTSTLTL